MAGNIYTWSTTASANASADADINWAEGQLPGTVNDSARAMMAGVAGFVKDNNATLTTSGSSNAYTATSNNTIAGLATGLRFVLKANFSNTAACTLNLNSFGAKAIRIFNAGGETDPSAGMIQTNGVYIFIYDSTANSAAGGWMLLNPTAPAVPGYIIFPQGRLTLTTAVPVLTSTVSAATTIYYTPYVGRMVPLYNGVAFTSTDIGGELSQTTTDTTKSPAAVTTNSNYDLFVWLDGSTYRCTRGPAWTSDTARGTGAGTTELVRVGGILLNNVSITNGPAAQRGTYVGTVRSNGSSQIDFKFSAVAAGGTAGVIGVWNMYNRAAVKMFVGDTADSWTYATATWRSANASNTMRVSFVSGLAEDCFSARYTSSMSMATGNGAVGIGIDSTSAFTGCAPFVSSTQTVACTGEATGALLGFHFAQAIENALSGVSVGFFGDGGFSSQNGMTFDWKC